MKAHWTRHFPKSPVFSDRVSSALYTLTDLNTGQPVFVGKRRQRDQVARLLNRYGRSYLPSPPKLRARKLLPMVVSRKNLGQYWPTWASFTVGARRGRKQYTWGWARSEAWASAIMLSLWQSRMRWGGRAISFTEFENGSDARIVRQLLTEARKRYAGNYLAQYAIQHLFAGGAMRT